jgi:drug/metabolite transporter (DMT)-like permease
LSRRQAALVALERASQGSSAWLTYVALALGVIGIAWAAIFVKWAQVPGPASAFYRLLLAAAILVPWQAPRLPLHTAPRAVALAALAGIFFALDLALWNTGLLYTSAANATLLANTAPIWVGLGTLWLFRERLSGWFWIGMTIALAGAALILGRDLLRPAAGANISAGDLFALGAGVFYGLYLLLAGRVRATLDTTRVMAIATGAGSAVLFITCLLFRAPLAGYSWQAWLALLGLGFVSQLGGVWCINYALGHLPAAVVSVTLLAQPVLVAILGVVLLGEDLGPVQIIGGALVLCGIYLVHRLGR